VQKIRVATRFQQNDQTIVVINTIALLSAMIMMAAGRLNASRITITQLEQNRKEDVPSRL
jgi:hypothetical protein